MNRRSCLRPLDSLDSLSLVDAKKELKKQTHKGDCEMENKRLESRTVKHAAETMGKKIECLFSEHC